MNVHGIEFRHVLTLNEVDGADENGPIIRYDVLDQDFLDVGRGVYIMTDGSEVLYCGKFTNTFAKRLLYRRLGHVYHFKRPEIAERIEGGSPIEVYSARESAIKDQLGESGNDWISPQSIESELVRQLTPEWNSIGA